MSIVIHPRALSAPPASPRSVALTARPSDPSSSAVQAGAVPTVGRRYLWTLRVLAVVGLLVSGYLGTVSLMSGKVAGCGSGSVFNCSHVMTTRWSQFAGIPVGVPAAALYATMLGLLCVPQSFDRLKTLRWSTISFTTLAAGLAALWFVGLQVFWVKHLCAYCLAAHSCGIALAALILWRRPAGLRGTGLAAAAAVLATAGLVTTQVLAAPPVTHEVIPHDAPTQSSIEPFAAPSETPFAAPGETLLEAPGETFLEAPGETLLEAPGETPNPPAASELDVFEAPVSRHLPAGGRPAVGAWQVAAVQWLHPGTMFTAQVDAAAAEPSERKTVKILNSVRLDVKHWPLLGSPDADYFFVEMLDYTCSHCRATHEAISQTRAAYGERLGVVLLPTPLDRQCNPHANSSGGQTAEACDLAKLSVAVWRLKPDKFEAFHHYLMTTPINYRAAYSHAQGIVGADALKKELDSGTPAAYIAKNVDLYNRAGKGAIPKLLFPTSSAVGEIRSASTLKNLVERHVVSPR